VSAESENNFLTQLRETILMQWWGLSICGLCFLPTYEFRVKLCTTFDLSTTK
jgi:hypothetical protein